MNTDQSVIDIKFKDVLARDLKSVLGKTLDELTKDLIKSSDTALGVSGTLTNLGIIPTKEGTIGGIRFAVDSARRDDVQKAMRDLLGQYAERAGVGKIASVLSNTDMQAFSEPFIRLPNDDPAYAKDFFDFIKSVGGEVLWSEQYKDYIALRTRIPHSHIKGHKLSTAQQLDERKREAFSLINAQLEANRVAADAEAIRKKDAGYVSETELAEQEERRRQLGIVTDEGSSIAKEQEQTGYFNKSLLYFAAITEIVRRILGFVTKIYDNALQLSYSAKAANVDADKLKALELALQGFNVDKGAAKSAVSLIAGGLMNPFQLNESLVGTIAPILGQSSADVVKNMLMGEGDTLGALTMIMEAARGKVASGGFTGTKDKAKAYAEVHKQLEAAGGGLESVFEAYMRAVDKDYELNKGVGDFGFSDFLRLFSVSDTEKAADAALQKSYTDTLIERKGLNYLFTNTYDPDALWTTNKFDTKPYKNKLEFYDALQGFGVTPAVDADTATLKDAVYGISSKGLSKDQQKILQRLKDTVNILDAWKGQKGTDYWESQGYALPMPRRYSADGTLESMLQGTEPGFFGGTVYNEIDNSVNTSSAAGGGSMDISLNIRGGGKDMGTYPLEINANNMITIDYWS